MKVMTKTNTSKKGFAINDLIIGRLYTQTENADIIEPLGFEPYGDGHEHLRIKFWVGHGLDVDGKNFLTNQAYADNLIELTEEKSVVVKTRIKMGLKP